ncbi:Replication gene A protein [Xenorhabdus cabanillasii JM26]|uniref:Replication gene A protein n=2 Tax=Xenorhabdus cabanillasii TaxID=351673 RepID=W1J6M6_9GAMM|nr:replication endonuclease [Xenorhabdus cabanillasii]PHM76986.1 replication protein A [Xenorhabdus cabanillasii JM26]CDL86379.1 Replication gene A protein [Xenorhabdus cabanillasii JM26]
MSTIEKARQNSVAKSKPRRQYSKFQPEMPQIATLAERVMWEVNPDDYTWCHQYFGHLPDSLAIYFVNRYANIFKSGRDGRRRANAFLRQFSKSVLPRFNLVSEQYQVQCEFVGAVPFPFLEQLDRLATLGRKEIRILAHGVSRYMSDSYEHYVSALPQPADEEKGREHLTFVYTQLAKLTQQIGTSAPYSLQFAQGHESLSDDRLAASLLRMMSDQWWYARLKRMRDVRAEHMAIAVGQVQKAASSYVSRKTLEEWKEQKRRNWEYLQEFELENEDGDRVSLVDKVLGSIANPAVRRCELMVRQRGFEDLANEMGCVGDFYTITAPSKYHSAHSGGGFVKNWNGASPRDTQKYLCRVWAKIRAAYSRAGISVFGFRVVEPHHDGTPHWHLLLFMLPEHVDKMRDIVREYAMQEDAHELNSENARNARFLVKRIDPEKGSATGYIAKYISKNIDGYALDGEVDNETGGNLKDMARSVSAWASRWRIRQFQQIGGAPVSVWRELRRLRGDKQILSDKDMDNVRFAADVGNWSAYTECQGGPLVARKDLTVRLAYEVTEEGNIYGEDVQRISGVYSPRLGESSSFITRTVKWKIVPKSSPLAADKGLAFDPVFSSSWSSVNNCTEARSTINKGKGLVEKVIDYADSIGMDFSRLMAQSLISNGKISVGEQPFKLWANGSFIPVESERQQETRRDRLRARIHNLGEMRKL